MHSRQLGTNEYRAVSPIIQNQDIVSLALPKADPLERQRPAVWQQALRLKSARALFTTSEIRLESPTPRKPA